ncbi:MAG: ATP-binding protein [Solirubrobacterales bacterium]
MSVVDRPPSKGSEKARRTDVSAATLRQRRRRAKLAAGPEIEFVREDWALFLDPRRLSQKAGCPRDRLRAMILKELVDNALDAGAEVTLDRLDPDTWLVTDNGRGLDRDQVVRLFAVDRPLVSTKLLHRPTRGAIGNGLRVVMGGAVASGGRLTVESRRARYALDVDRATGGTVVIEEGPSDITAGTRVTIAFGPELAGGADDGDLALLAICCAGPAVEPMRSHPSWYGEDDFAELVHAAPAGTTLTDFAAMFGIGLEADRPVTVADLALLKARAGRAPDLLPLGADRFPGFYAKERGKMGGVPVLAEAWVTAARCPPSHGRGTVTLLVNRSPVTAAIRILPDRTKRLTVWGCNLARCVDRASPGALYEVVLAVTSPAVPVTTEGKEPDLRPLWPVIEAALAGAMHKAYRAATRTGRRHGDLKEAAYAVMERAYREAAGTRDMANARQIFYVGRRLMQPLLPPGTKISDDRFIQDWLPDFRADHPDLTRDWKVAYAARGTLTEPHTGRCVPVGTLEVDDYLLPRHHRHGDLVAVDDALYPTVGPENRYATLLYIEKAGFEPLLDKARIRERFDCGIFSTQGMSVTEARRIVDHCARLGVRILVAHDFDRAGACIAYTLGHDTRRYRFLADPEVIDLGLGLSEAREMGLEDEEAPKEGPGEDKLREYGLDKEEIEFLIGQGRRYELNAMNSDQFVRWIEGKLEKHCAGKVVPETDVLVRHARRVLARREVTDALRPLIAEAEAKAAAVELPADLAEQIEDVMDEQPELSWEEALEIVLDEDVTPGEG